ncbi:E3 ubiquitin-protein ligase synoviolin A-like isoform X2 [Ruditapes philippinarum]|uniref:E3 ubiquitin-protein ligase synoviolin A-like isoform X2 n=1 Tax=Ruditapes philippinarum TaxID=129788 RepID=UPI00295ADF0F|nr:E3 ubiquitin-protein ligase synoviolin A-like isoform X2 [Ruditapes philippinarum]
MQEMKSFMLTCGSFALTASVVGNAFYQKRQFYPSVVYITKSNPSMAVLYLQAFVFVILMGKLFRKIFFGQLRAAEMEHLIERSWYAVTETCLAFTVFRDDFSPKFVASFTLLLFLKCFHWLAEDRVDFMERSPVISFLFHVRVLSLLSFLSVIDAYFVNFAYHSTLTKGASVQLVFGFEYAILVTIVMMATMKYVLHSIDLQSENPWENKAVYLLYSELVLGFVKVILYMTFTVIMIKIHTFPLFAIRPMYLSVRGFKKSLHDVIMSRRAIRQMNTLYPDVSAEELQSGDNVCIICREDMVMACKKLPCNHIFHTSCLRSWFQRQQTCPTCRMEVLRMQPTRPTPQQPPFPQQQHIQPQFPNMFGAGFPQMPPMWPQQMPQQQQQAQQANQPQQTQESTSPQTPPTTPAGSVPPPPPSAGLPPMPGGIPTGMPGAMPNMASFMPMFPMFMPNNFPRPPSSLSGLSVEELRSMEGVERENIEARIQWLRDIQALLDGAMLLMQQYNSIATSSSTSGINLSQPLQTRSTPPVFTSPGEETGARPKYSKKTQQNIDDENSKKKTSEPEGASGFTPEVEEYIPKWDDPRTEEYTDEMVEVRRRRLEKFLSDTKTSENNLTDTDKKSEQ